MIGFSTIGIQGGSLASAFGAIDRISAAAPVAFLRELGPLLTTAIVAGTLGSTITAEIGARKIREELLALEILGINPVRNLILPRVVGLALWMPVLSLLTFWAGILGTFTAAVLLYGSTVQAYFSQLLTLTNFIDLWGSVVKLTLFGVIIGVIAAYKGLQVGGGAEGVGTRRQRVGRRLAGRDRDRHGRLHAALPGLLPGGRTSADDASAAPTSAAARRRRHRRPGRARTALGPEGGDREAEAPPADRRRR